MNTTSLTVQQDDPTVVANLMNEQRFGRMMIIAETMASASLIPDHLVGKKVGGKFEYFTADEIRANCFLIVNQAFRWGMDPFAVMPETYVVGGKLGYQGKLVAGLVNSLADLEERLSYSYSGQPGTDDFTVTVSGKFRGAKESVSVKVSVGQAKTDNQMWKKDPEQKLAYTGATKWARRWCPEILLGILIDDDDHPSMREAVGHVVETTAPTRVITGNDTPAPATKQAASAKAEAPAKAAKTPKKQAPATPAEPTPERELMVNEIKAAFKNAGLTFNAAQEVCRKAKLLGADVSLADISDEEMGAIFDRREELFPALPIIQAFYEGHKVSHSPADAERKWTRWNLVYQEAGGTDQQEASTFSKTIGDTLDALEGGEALLLRIAPGEKFGTIISLELVAPNTGGEA